MPSTDSQVRVFISSTFRDMHAERDHLVTVVFPELRERVERLGLEFFDVDLRWGVPDRDANGETANSWEYCRQWIDRVEPFFVCLLGQRYGWVPKVKDFKDAADQARQAEEPRSITDLEVCHAVLDSRRKRRSYFYLRATEAPATAGEYVDPAPWSGKLAQLKNAVRSCGRPVREYPCEWTGSGFVGLEEFGRLVLEDLWSGVLRDERYVSKDIWRQVLKADPDADPRYTDESQPVPRELWERIVTLAKPAPKEPLDAEREGMDAFAASRLRWFQGRETEIRQLTGFIESTEENAPRLAVVAAVPGQGKSALLAHLHEGLKSSPHVVITHFVGATEQSATAYALVKRLLDELDHNGIAWPADDQPDGQEPKLDYNSLCLRLAQRLGDYAGERRIVILLDALNQLTDGHDLSWLPTRLGPSVRVIVSCVEDAAAKPDSTEQRVLRALDSRQPVPLRVSLEPLTETDVRTIVVSYLEEYCKELDTPHVDAFCAMPQARNPLYLLVMLGELRTLGGNDMNRIVPELIAAMPQDHPDPVSLFRWVLQRLEVFGPDAVQWWCLYLAHGRTGMASQELADLLARKLGPDAAPTALRIERALRRYLQRRGAQIDFFHGQLRQAVMEEYGPRCESPLVHYDMADYFTDSARGIDPRKEWETEAVRGFAECVYHRIEAGQYDMAADLLTTFPFLLHKLRVGLLEGVFDDYDIFPNETPTAVAKQLEICSVFFREKAHILRRGTAEWPAHKIFLQLAVEHADDSPLTLSAETWLADGRCDWYWLRRPLRLPHAQASPCLATLEGHPHFINGAKELSDRRVLSWSTDGTLCVWDSRSGVCLSTLTGHSGEVYGAIELTDGRLLSWARDDTLRLWDSRGGRSIATLKGHTGWIKGALQMIDGRLLSWSADKSLRVWDGTNGNCQLLMNGHTDDIWGVLCLANGRLLSWSKDLTLRIWDSQTDVCVAVLTGHTYWIDGAVPLADGRLLSWARDGTLRLWDSQTGDCLSILKGHTNSVLSASVLADGNILSWSSDDTLKLWDSQNGACIATLSGHTGPINGALQLANGCIVSWSNDKTLRIWDHHTGASLMILEGHTFWITGVMQLDNGHLLSWAHDDTLRLWNSAGVCVAVLKGHTDMAHGGVVAVNGRLISWAKDRILKIWDSQTGASLGTLEGHAGNVSGVLVLCDGLLLSWSSGDKTLRLWDSQISNYSKMALERHTDSITDLLVLADGRLLSWSYDNTLRLWDDQIGTCIRTFKGHTSAVKGALELTDGRLLSWSRDNTLRLWDCHTGICLRTLSGHMYCPENVLALDNDRILSWSAFEESMRLWDSKSNECLSIIMAIGGHTHYVRGAMTLADGRLLSWSFDHTLKLWNSHTGACLVTLKGHTDIINGVIALTDGRILSWSDDTTLKLWDSNSGVCLATFEGHTDKVYGAVCLSDGRLLSWAGTYPGSDYTPRLWDSTSGVCLITLTGHTEIVRGALVMTDGHLLTWSLQEMRLWDSRSGKCLDVVPRELVAKHRPAWWFAHTEIENVANTNHEFLIEAFTRMVQLRHKSLSAVLANWTSDTGATSRCLLPNGTAVVTQPDGQVCILKLYHGSHHISLTEATALLSQ